MAKQIWLNLPVKDVKKAKDFFIKIGFVFKTERETTSSACMLVGESNFVVMLFEESLFEGFVNSVANARGLMQIIPPTGAQIATELGRPLDYTEDDLYRPYVSILFGTHYLANNRTLFNGDIYPTLAAYNGGPGNALAWKELAGDDPDLFLESVRFEETRNYIRNIYEINVIYRSLYRVGEQ